MSVYIRITHYKYIRH